MPYSAGMVGNSMLRAYVHQSAAGSGSTHPHSCVYHWEGAGLNEAFLKIFEQPVQCFTVYIMISYIFVNSLMTSYFQDFVNSSK